MMKVVAFNGSPTKNGNTAIAIYKVFEEIEKAGIKTECVHIGGKPVRGCMGCRKCTDIKNLRCTIEGDIINFCLEKMVEADGIILASPVYFANVTPEIKALIDRAGVVAKANNNFLKNKAGVSVVSLKRGGDVHAFNSMNFFFLANEMIVPGSSYWNMYYGNNPGEQWEDREGFKNMQNIGQKMAWLLKKLHN